MLSSSSTMSSSSAFSSYQNQDQSQTGVPSSNPLSGTTMNSFSTAMNPQQVTAAVSNPSFYRQKKPFWQMLCYLFVDYQGRKVHQFLPPDTFRSICLQLHALIEDEDDYAVIQSNAKLLYHTYFILLGNIRANKTITRLIVDENQDLLTALYQTYKRLLDLRIGTMPLCFHHLS